MNYLSEVEGVGGIRARVVADSIAHGIRLTTLELKYPRFIHSEFMTHRMFSRNASSSRAIPVATMIEQVKETPAKPIHWGQNKPGMQAEKELEDTAPVANMWKQAADMASRYTEAMSKSGLHKQVANRLLEPFQFMRTLVTATEWGNFFSLRLHHDAQPEIHELALVMKEAINSSNRINHLREGQWHTPYGEKSFFDSMEFNGIELRREDIERLTSAGRCARVSYNNHDKSKPNIIKDVELAYSLLQAGHMSPFEHQATPMRFEQAGVEEWEPGVTHIDRRRMYWSGNFRGWVQYRQIL